MLALKDKVSTHLSRLFADPAPSDGPRSRYFPLNLPSFTSRPSKEEAAGSSDHDYGHLKDEDDEIIEPQIYDSSPNDPLSNLSDESSFITLDLYSLLEPALPNIVKGCRWTLLYSTKKDGISLKTLIRKSAENSGPCLLIAGDREGAVFGGLLESPITPTPKRKYQGGNQSFVFTTARGDPRLYRPTGRNRYFVMCTNDLLAMGGGGSFALRLDGDLLHGSSGPSDTYSNICLANTHEFELKHVELWGFTHSIKS